MTTGMTGFAQPVAVEAGGIPGEVELTPTGAVKPMLAVAVDQFTAVDLEAAGMDDRPARRGDEQAWI
jgi:hypothetical protein